LTILRKIIRGSLYITYLILVVIILLEIAYRYQIVDFYGKHLRGLNSKTVLANKENKETLLVLGDSFSASPFSYVSHLKDSLPELNVVNASISGTSLITSQKNILVAK